MPRIMKNARLPYSDLGCFFLLSADGDTHTIACLAHIGLMSRLSGPRSLLSVLLGINGQH